LASARAESADHGPAPDRDGRDQQDAAKDEPTDGVSSNPGFMVERVRRLALETGTSAVTQ